LSLEWTEDAEVLNGRLAMIGIAGLVVLELSTGAGLLHFLYSNFISPSLEIVGFAFFCWFVFRQVLLRDARTELFNEVVGFVDRVKGAE